MFDLLQKALEDALNENALNISFTLSRFPEIQADLERTYERSKLVAKPVKENLESGKEVSSRLILLLLACAMGIYRDIACRKALSKPDLNLDNFWKALTIRTFFLEKKDPGVINWLQSQKTESVLASLRKAPDTEGWIYAEYPFQCLEAAEVPGRYTLLFEALEGRWDDEIKDDANNILLHNGQKAVESALERWKDNLPSIKDFSWLELGPTQGAVRFLEDNFEHYITSKEAPRFSTTLKEIGARDFFEPMLKKWRPGEPYLGKDILVLAELNDIHDKRLDLIVREVTEWEEKYASPFQEQVADTYVMHRHEVPIPLQCTACGHTYHYVLENLYADKDKQEVIIGQIIQCNGCGSIEIYEQTQETRLALMSRMVTDMALVKSGEIHKKDLFKDSRIFKGSTIGEKEVRTFSEAYHALRQEVEHDPQNSE